jgi:aspartate-semialdehyde dehydrogenase
MDRAHQDGAGVNVGRVRQCPVLDIKFVVLADNVSIGAATSSIINAEFAVLKGVVG